MATAKLRSLERELAKLRKAVARHDVTLEAPPGFLDFLPLCSLQIESGEWVPFDPWPAQRDAAATLVMHRLNAWLKARQLGMTWLALAFALWTALQHPGCTVLLFSRRDQEATELLDRVKGMARRLPERLRPRSNGGNSHVWPIGNGSRVLAFPTTAGDSYTAKLAIVDEADLVPDLDKLMGAVKPTIDAGGSMLLLSRADKAKPASLFKRTYLAAKARTSDWHATFLPWHARPDRDQAWYEAQKRDILSRTGSLDRLYEQYPATDDEALAPNQLDKRIPIEWIVASSHAIDGKPCVTIPCCRLFADPEPERRYVIGGDPAEGNPTSDDSAACVLDADTGVQVATLQGKIQPVVFADYVAKLSAMYNGAPAMPERNNHGHAVIEALLERNVRVLTGHDGKYGWLSSGKGKVLLYDGCTEALQEGQVVIRDALVVAQLASIEGGTLRAPEGTHDDLADAFALAVAAMNHPSAKRRPVAIGGSR